MALKFGPSSINPTSPNPLQGNGKSVQDVRVKDIVLSPNHPKFEEVGGWAGLGTIFYDSTSSPGLGSPNKTLSKARPFFSNSKFYPLINEIVAIVTMADPIESQNPLKSSQKLAYYFPPVNSWNSVHHNALPDSKISNPVSAKKNYKQVENGGVNRDRVEETSIFLGNTFEEKSQVPPLFFYEGDHILEGRWGNTIRLGSTVNHPDIPNKWSSEGGEGDPLTIIRVSNPNQTSSSPGWVPVLEDTTKDLSSIYLTSTQKIPFFPSSFKTDSFGPQDDTPESPSEYQGNQIILDSGRLILNSKSDGILLSSPNTIHLSAGSSVNLDCGDKIVLSTGEVYLTDRNADQRAVLGDALVLELQKLLPALEGLAKACAVASAGPFPVPSLVSIGPSVSSALLEFKKALAGHNPKILSKKVKLK